MREIQFPANCYNCSIRSDILRKGRIIVATMIATNVFIPECLSREKNRPNILVVVSDDQSFPYASAYGTKSVNTPAFDYLSRLGCLFNNAFVTSPGSSPSRASILTGLYPWQIENAGTHASSFPSKYVCFTDILSQDGYAIGYTGKGWGPGNWKVSGRVQNPAGPEFNDIKLVPPHKGISNIDYAGNFEAFLSNNRGRPFCFWVGTFEPHRPYEYNCWKTEGKDPKDVFVPSFLPDEVEVKGDILDYITEIEWFDSQLNKIIDILKENGEFDNTLIIVTSDNGMPFPSAKANCYEYGIHVPLVICWVKGKVENKISNDLVSSIDIFPTILDACGINIPKKSEGTSLLKYLRGDRGNTADRMIFAGRERHSSSRYNNLGYPIRALRTDEYLYIRNFHPERWPAGDPYFYKKDGTISSMHEAYFDIDKGPAINYMIENRDSVSIFPFFIRATAKRPVEELYNIKSDPGCMNNLAGDKRYLKLIETYRKALEKELRKTKDSRFIGPDEEIWEQYPRLVGENRIFDKPLFLEY